MSAKILRLAFTEMDKNTMVGIGVVVLILIGGIIWANTSKDDTDDREDDEEEMATTSEEEEGDDLVAPQSSTETRTAVRTTPASESASTPVPDTAPSLPTTATVRYTDGGFEPRTVRIAQGGTVTFVNESGGAMWVASDNHPSHMIYAAFDQDASVGAGGTYMFPFLQSGSWGFHNHMNASHTGTVIVGN